MESRSISGVTRTVTGRILRNQDYCKRQLRDTFAPGVTGRLTVAGAYWCDAEVQRTPDISVSGPVAHLLVSSSTARTLTGTA